MLLNQNGKHILFFYKVLFHIQPNERQYQPQLHIFQLVNVSRIQQECVSCLRKSIGTSLAYS